MRRTDFYIQTALILIAFFTALSAFALHDNIGIILLVQLILGPWQMISALLYIGFKTTYKKGRQIHLISASTYVLVLYLVWSSLRQMESPLVLSTLTIPAWILAIHYYVITWLTVFPKQKNESTFLPHLNF